MEKELGIAVEGLKVALWTALQKSGLPGPVVVLILEGMVLNIELGEAKQKLAAVKGDLSLKSAQGGDCEKGDSGSA